MYHALAICARRVCWPFMENRAEGRFGGGLGVPGGDPSSFRAVLYVLVLTGPAVARCESTPLGRRQLPDRLAGPWPWAAGGSSPTLTAAAGPPNRHGDPTFVSLTPSLIRVGNVYIYRDGHGRPIGLESSSRWAGDPARPGGEHHRAQPDG